MPSAATCGQMETLLEGMAGPDELRCAHRCRRPATTVHVSAFTRSRRQLVLPPHRAPALSEALPGGSRIYAPFTRHAGFLTCATGAQAQHGGHGSSTGSYEMDIAWIAGVVVLFAALSGLLRLCAALREPR